MNFLALRRRIRLFDRIFISVVTGPIFAAIFVALIVSRDRLTDAVSVIFVGSGVATAALVWNGIDAVIRLMKNDRGTDGDVEGP